LEGDRDGASLSANTAESWVLGGCLANGTLQERVDAVDDTLVLLRLESVMTMLLGVVGFIAASSDPDT
jgi:hypothetical protein